MSSEGRSRFDWTDWLLFGCVLALTVALSLQKIRSFDYWWHLRTGQLIVETGSVPSVDPYSYTALGSPWIDIHWLFQLVLYGSHSLGGIDGVMLFKTLAIGATVAASAVSHRAARGAMTSLPIGLMLLVASDRFLVRPELPSFLFLALILLLLDREQRREGPADAWLWLAIPIQLVWVNMHGLFALGVVLVGIYFGAELLWFVWPGSRSMRRDRVSRFGLLGVAFVAVAFANPNGWDGAVYPLQQLGMIGLEDTRGLFGERIAELQPPITRRGIAQPLLVAFSACLAGLALTTMLLARKTLALAHPLVFVAFAFLGLSASRNLALFAIVCVPIVVRNGNAFLDRYTFSPRSLRIVNVMTAVALISISIDVASGRFFDRMGSPRVPGSGIQGGIFPIGAMDWIARERPPGPICHDMPDGALVIAKLYPDYSAMLDGRLEIYGTDRFGELVIEGPKSLQVLDDQFHFGSILINYGLRPPGGLLWWLHANQNWRLVFADEISALYVRVPEDRDLQWPELDIDAPDFLPDRETAWGGVEDRRRNNRWLLFFSLRRYERALMELDKRLARSSAPQPPDLVALREQLRVGIAESRQLETALIQRRQQSGEDALMLTQLGQLRLRNGNWLEASRLYDRAMRISPELPQPLLRRAQLAEERADNALAIRLYERLAGLEGAAGALRSLARDRLRLLRAAAI